MWLCPPMMMSTPREGCAVDVFGAVGVADAGDLGGRVLDVDQRADQAFFFCVRQHLLGQDADEEDAHPVDLADQAGAEQADAVKLNVHVGVYDGEGGAFFEK